MYFEFKKKFVFYDSKYNAIFGSGKFFLTLPRRFLLLA